MKNTIAKLNSKKGFTLMEMLIVIAIIAVLVAIAIPTFSGALTKSQEAADVANIRAAYAEVVIKYLTDNEAYPTDKAGFIEVIDEMGASLSEDASGEDGKLTYVASGTDTYVITYTSSSLNDEPYTWTITK